MVDGRPPLLRHIYAITCQICTFTSLGLLIAHSPITGQRKDGKLLCRNNFKDQLDKVLKPHPQEPPKSSPHEPLELAPDGLPPDRETFVFAPDDQRRITFREKLDGMGIPYDEISTHSYRKGSASNAASGSTNGPPIVAICLRAGWKLGGVLNTYLCLENAGDCFVGRVAAGLPLLSPRFSVLPPRFPEDVVEKALRPRVPNESEEIMQARADYDLMNRAMFMTFGNHRLFGQNFSTCLRYSLASLCFHKEWL